MVKVILVQPVNNALGAAGLVPGFQTEHSHSFERDNSTESTKFGAISAIGTLTETMSLSMYGKEDDEGQLALLEAIEKGEEIKIWEVDTKKNKDGTYNARFAFAVIDSHEVSSPAEGLEEISTELTVQIQSVRGTFATLPESLITFAKYGFQLPGETTGDSRSYTKEIVATAIDVTPATVTTTVGGTEQLNVAFTPTDTKNKQVTYTSANDTIATVTAAGLVQGVATGSTTVTVTPAGNPSLAKTVNVTIS